eukprot:TRINITY_DN73277_c0_g1_i1.p1 TRINITY_DN73277_c0_g1~~TRINITY_DN73277_c0_g1_i1.p1  ORF type:complete len:506 (+),score=78.54 TRINITY_DN73277_c0_g1_i1:198-1520(+)
MSHGQEDFDYDEGSEISLLQTSQKLSRQEVPPASEEGSTQIHRRESVDRASATPTIQGIASSMENVTGALGSGNFSNRMMLAMVSLSQRVRRTRDIIPLPGACVLGLAFLVTFTCVVVLWGLMMEAAYASKAPAPSNEFEESADLDMGATISFGKLPRFHVFESQPVAQQTTNSQAPPPPRMCPALTLPAGVDQFRIPAQNLNRLRAGDLAVEILGPDDKPLLHAGFPLRAMENAKGQIGYDKVGRWLQLTRSATDKQPLVCIGPLPTGNQNGPRPNRFQNVQVRGIHGVAAAGRVPIQIFGPTNARYGSLSRKADKWHVFYSAAQGPEQLLLSMHSAMPFPGFAAYSKDGKEIALASMRLTGTEFSSADMLTITVKPGFDHMMILVTMLAVMLSMFEQVPSNKGTDAAGDSHKSLPHATSQSLPLATSHSLPPGFQPDT